MYVFSPGAALASSAPTLSALRITAVPPWEMPCSTTSSALSRPRLASLVMAAASIFWPLLSATTRRCSQSSRLRNETRQAERGAAHKCMVLASVVCVAALNRYAMSHIGMIAWLLSHQSGFVSHERDCMPWLRATGAGAGAGPVGGAENSSATTRGPSQTSKGIRGSKESKAAVDAGRGEHRN